MWPEHSSCCPGRHSTSSLCPTGAEHRRGLCDWYETTVAPWYAFPPKDRCSRKPGAVFCYVDDTSPLQSFGRPDETSCSFPTRHHRALYLVGTKARIAWRLRGGVVCGPLWRPGTGLKALGKASSKPGDQRHRRFDVRKGPHPSYKAVMPVIAQAETGPWRET